VANRFGGFYACFAQNDNPIWLRLCDHGFLLLPVMELCRISPAFVQEPISVHGLFQFVKLPLPTWGTYNNSQ
jgi:hypothetical protein